MLAAHFSITRGSAARIECRMNSSGLAETDFLPLLMLVQGWVAVQSWVATIFVPLNFLGGVYATIIQAFIDIRNLSQVSFNELKLGMELPSSLAAPCTLP